MPHNAIVHLNNGTSLKGHIVRPELETFLGPDHCFDFEGQVADYTIPWRSVVYVEKVSELHAND